VTLPFDFDCTMHM